MKFVEKIKKKFWKISWKGWGIPTKVWEDFFEILLFTNMSKDFWRNIWKICRKWIPNKFLTNFWNFRYLKYIKNLAVNFKENFKNFCRCFRHLYPVDVIGDKKSNFYIIWRPSNFNVNVNTLFRNYENNTLYSVYWFA